MTPRVGNNVRQIPSSDPTKQAAKITQAEVLDDYDVAVVSPIESFPQSTDKKTVRWASEVGHEVDDDPPLPIDDWCNDADVFDKRVSFLQRLMAVLGDDSISSIASWLPHGRAFVIKKPELFSEEVIPILFPNSKLAGSDNVLSYRKFLMKLIRW